MFIFLLYTLTLTPDQEWNAIFISPWRQMFVLTLRWASKRESRLRSNSCLGARILFIARTVVHPHTHIDSQLCNEIKSLILYIPPAYLIFLSFSISITLSLSLYIASYLSLLFSISACLSLAVLCLGLFQRRSYHS